MSIGLIVDIAVLAVILVSVVISVLRGFIREVLTIFGLVAASTASYVLGPMLLPTTNSWLGVEESPTEPQMFLGLIPSGFVSQALAYGLIFAGFLIIVSIISYFISKAVRNMGLGIVDRTMGAVFGLARAVLVLGLLYLLPYYMIEDEQKKDIFADSKSQMYLETTAHWIDGFIPKIADEDVQTAQKEASDVSDAVSQAREKFQEMGILQEENSDSAETKKGYDEGFRDEMDALIDRVEGTEEEEEAPLTPVPPTQGNE